MTSVRSITRYTQQRLSENQDPEKAHAYRQLLSVFSNTRERNADILSRRMEHRLLLLERSQQGKDHTQELALDTQKNPELKGYTVADLREMYPLLVGCRFTALMNPSLLERIGAKLFSAATFSAAPFVFILKGILETLFVNQPTSIHFPPLWSTPSDADEKAKEILRKRNWTLTFIITAQPDSTTEISSPKGYLREVNRYEIGDHTRLNTIAFVDNWQSIAYSTSRYDLKTDQCLERVDELFIPLKNHGFRYSYKKTTPNEPEEIVIIDVGQDGRSTLVQSTVAD